MSSQWGTHSHDLNDVKTDLGSRRQFPDVGGQVEFGSGLLYGRFGLCQSL